MSDSPVAEPPPELLKQVEEELQIARNAPLPLLSSPPDPDPGPSTLASDPPRVDGPPSRQAVVLLGIDKFIARNKKHIYDWLENAARGIGLESHLAFFAESLPLVSAIIHVGSSRACYDNAKRWVMDEKGLKKPPGSEASVLSALTFTYLVEEGYKDSRKQRSRLDRKLWEHMHQLIDAFQPKAQSR